MAAPASDFRSDTVTRPTPEMRAAMAAAEVGDDVLDGDPTVARLQERAAEWLGKAGALFVPSGTMANQVAAGSWGRPGEEVILERGAHMVAYEAGALSALHGLQQVTLPGERGALDPEAVRTAVRPASIHSPRTAFIAVEQTHMSSGGRVVPLERLRAIADVARGAGVPVHLDGARLGNAVIASGVPAATWASCADSVSVCLSKGLGAPVGSIVAGDAAFLERARVLRKRLGGWMRQSGHLAAAGLLALERGLERLGEDHALARRLAEALSSFAGLDAPAGDVETNLVLCRVGPGVRSARDGAPLDAPALAALLGERGVGTMALAPDRLRFVTHRDVGERDVARLREALEAILGAP